jgi:hypothetical protein
MRLAPAISSSSRTARPQTDRTSHNSLKARAPARWRAAHGLARRGSRCYVRSHHGGARRGPTRAHHGRGNAGHLRAPVFRRGRRTGAAHRRARRPADREPRKASAG